jgi:hypothetical protein
MEQGMADRSKRGTLAVEWILRRGERGTALLCALVVTALLTTLGASVVVVVVGETLVAAHHRASQQGLYAADAGFERAVGELRSLSTWQGVPAPAGSSGSPDFNDGALVATLADRTPLDLAQLTANRQRESDAFYPNTPDRPQWRLFGHASLARMIADDAGSAPPYVVVWVADDPDDRDGDPTRDSNDIVIVRSHAFGVGGAKRSVEATIVRRSALDGAAGGGATRSDVSVIAWREVR